MKHIPQYLFSKRFLYMTVLYITIFSVIFMNIYTPFSTTAWFNLQDESLTMATIMFYILAVLFLLFSKSILHDISRKVSFSTFRLLLYYLTETAILALLYTLFTTIPNQTVFSNSIIDIYFKSVACIGMILIIPYTICYLYGLSKGLSEQLNHTGSNNSENNSHLINIRDHKDKIKLSLLSDDIFYIVSEDNYIKIFYEQNNEIHSSMIRTSSKSIEEALSAHNIIRCHRSYMVNTNKIQFFNNDRNNLYVLLTNRKINPIPVSRTYRELMETELSKRQR